MVQEPVAECDSVNFSCIGNDTSSPEARRRRDCPNFEELPSFGPNSGPNKISMDLGRIDYVLGPLICPAAVQHENYTIYCSSGNSSTPSIISRGVQLSIKCLSKYTRK